VKVWCPARIVYLTSDIIDEKLQREMIAIAVLLPRNASSLSSRLALSVSSTLASRAKRTNPCDKKPLA